jgi:tetratricopeptide (TPR) repeat protein
LKDPAYWAQLCTLQAKSKPAEAVTACERAIELRPGDPQLWARYGSLQLGLQQYPEAIASLEQALKRQPKNSQALTAQCIAWKELGDKEAALAACDKALQVNANWGDRSPLVAHHYRSTILNEEKAFQEAIKVYEAALKQEPNDSLTLFYRGEALEKLGQQQAAIESYQQALNGNGNWGSENPAIAWYIRGLTHRSSGELELAVQALDRALFLNPNHGPTWFQQGETLRQLQRLTESLIAYNRAVELQPNSSQTLLAQCRVLNQLQQAEAALAACQKAIQGDGVWGGEATIAHALNQQSLGFTSVGKLEEALAMANRVVGMRPDWGQGWSDRAVVLWYFQRYDEALASVEKALAINPDDTQAWANQGRIWRSPNKPQNALNAYTEALKRDPQNASVWANLSALQWSLGDHAAALESATRAIIANPNLAQGWQNHGTALVALKQYKDAQKSFEQAIQLDKTNAEAWTGLGLALAQLEQYPKAIEALQMAIGLNPQQSVAQQALKAVTLLQEQTLKPEKEPQKSP